MSVELKLKANTPTERRILDYLQANASDVLADKINAGSKTLAGAVEFAKDEARKIAGGEGCVCVDDATVFGWIIHFFEEDSITEKAKRPAVRVPAGVAKRSSEPAARAHAHNRAGKAKAKPPKPAAPETPADPQLTMFDALLRGTP